MVFFVLFCFSPRKGVTTWCCGPIKG